MGLKLAVFVARSQKNSKFSSNLSEESVISVIFATSCPSEAEVSVVQNEVALSKSQNSTQTSAFVKLPIKYEIS